MCAFVLCIANLQFTFLSAVARLCIHAVSGCGCAFEHVCMHEAHVRGDE